ncbi:MAG: type II secretion system protein GspC [Polyangiaceae bacterium]
MAFDRIAQKNFGIALLCGTALAAFLSALGIVRIAQAAVLSNADLLAAAPVLAKPKVNAAANASARSADPILARNPFDSVTGPFLSDAIGTRATGAGSDLANAPLCEGVKVLIIAQASDPDWSFVAMSSNAANATSDSKAQLRRRGDDFGGKHLQFVSWDRVWLSSGGVLCQAALFKGSQAVKADTTKASEPAGDSALTRGIHRVSANEFQIDRSVVDKILETQAELMKVRVVPEQEKGKTVGIRLYGIKSGSLLEAVGFENGDRLETVNGLEISTPDGALAAYAQLRAADRLIVKINRKGSESEIDYDIH